MGARTRSWFLTLLVASPAGAGDDGVASRVLYRRATPLEARTGVVAVREVQEARVDVPTDCPGAEPATFGCRQERRFPRAYVLDFALERRESRGDTAYLALEDRGRLSLFLEFDRDDRDAFDDELRRVLTGLSADSFAQPFAGLRSSGLPEIAQRSVEPSWSCFESGSSREAGRHDRRVERLPDGSVRVVGSGTTSHGAPAVTDPLCAAGAAMADSVPAEELRTMPVARVLREETVHVVVVDRLLERAARDELAPLPSGASYTVARAPGVQESTSIHRGRPGEAVRASYARNETRFTAVTAPADLPSQALAANSWLARWVLETVERHMGPRPEERVEGRVEFRVALLPTLPPTPADDSGQEVERPEGEEHTIALDVEAFLAEIAARLDRSAALDPATLENAVAERPVGLGGPGWILAVCRTGGEASYRLAPTAAVSAVRNASTFCAAVDRLLGTGAHE